MPSHEDLALSMQEPPDNPEPLTLEMTVQKLYREKSSRNNERLRALLYGKQSAGRASGGTRTYAEGAGSDVEIEGHPTTSAGSL